LLALSAALGLEIDRHQATPGHSGGHCVAGPGCASAAVVPEAAALRLGKYSPRLVRTDLLAHERNIRPPLHPPNPAVQA
jgi:hypothetical protein